MVFNRKYYKLCFIIYMFINTLALGYLGIETNYLFVPLLIWALVIIVHDIYKKKFKLKTVSYTHLRAHETGRNLVCRLLLEKKKKKKQDKKN